MAPNGSVYVPIADQVGTTWALLDESGDKVNSYTYDAFGVGRSISETVANRYRFGTKRLDSDPALYHFIARQYVPATGRFASADPWGLPMVGTKDWQLVQQRPTAFVDPLGYWTWPDRKNNARAETCVEFDGESPMELATLARMDPPDWSGEGGWLRAPDGSPVALDHFFRAGEKFTVPNTVWIDWVELSTTFWYDWARAEQQRLEREGFLAVLFGTANEGELVFQLGDVDTFGITVLSHYPEGGLDKGPLYFFVNGRPRNFGPRRAAGNLHHKLGCFKAVWCFSACAPWELLVTSSYGSYFASWKKLTVWDSMSVPYGCLGWQGTRYLGRKTSAACAPIP